MAKKTPKKLTEKQEYTRLKKLFRNLPANKLKVVDGLITEAARLRVRLNTLWDDLVEKGETEMFSQSANAEPYERERPASRAYTSTNKAYQSIIKQLTDLCPDILEKDDLDDF